MLLEVLRAIDEQQGGAAPRHTCPADAVYVPEVLYHWRDVTDSVARSNLGKALQGSRLAIRQYFERAGIDAAVKGCRHAIIFNRIEWPLPTAGVQLIVYGD